MHARDTRQFFVYNVGTGLWVLTERGADAKTAQSVFVGSEVLLALPPENLTYRLF